MPYSPPARASLREVLQRIATGPEHSKDLGRGEAAAATGLVLDGVADPVQAGVYFIALRMKRESDDEYLGVLDALRARARTAQAPVPELVDLSDPYDGFNRHTPANAFLPCVLAACGLPAVAHGVARLGPKFGVTHHAVLRAAGAAVDLEPAAAAGRVADPRVGWAYVDQARHCPSLAALGVLRERIVKRPTLSTVERVLGPLRAAGQTHLVLGFVHRAYPRVYGLLAAAAGYAGVTLVRGVEGGVTPALSQPGHLFRAHEDGQPGERVAVNPETFGIEAGQRAPALPEAVSQGRAGSALSAADTERLADAAARAGLLALNGERGRARDALVLGAGLVLWQLGRADAPPGAAAAVRRALDDGSALARFQAGAAKPAAVGGHAAGPTAAVR